MGNGVNIVGVRDHDFGKLLGAVGQALLAPFRFLAWLGHVSFRVGLFIVFQLPIVIAGLLALAIAGLVIASVANQIYEHNHDPALRLRQKEVVVVALRQADERNDRDNRAHGFPPVRPEDRLAPPLEAQIAALQAQIAQQQREERGAH